MQFILLVDMDYFFVACEELRNKEIRNRSTIVGADPKKGGGRGVVMTCNYEARKYGIRSGMPISTAYRLKPDALYLPMDYDYYENISKELMKLIKEHADKFEEVSIDEAFIDISKRVQNYEEALRFAEKLKKEIKDKIGLPCSIGISYNKLIAKMACEAAKPNGIKVIKEEEAKAFLKNMNVDDLYGVGKKTKEKLEKLGYTTIGELARANEMLLIDKFGSFGIDLHNYANGTDESPVNENYEVKSIGREYTFETDINNEKEAIKVIDRLSKEVLEDVKKQGVAFKVITIKLRYSDFSEHLKSRSIRYSNELKELLTVAGQLYRENVDKGKKVRKVGVRVSGFIKRRGQKLMNEYAK